MRFTTIRAAARARRRFIRDYDPARGYVYRTRVFRNGFEVDVYSHRGAFLTII